MSNLIEREYVELRSRRVALRERRKRLLQAAIFEQQKRYGPDGYNNAIAWAEAELRGTERRWQELCLLLGKPLPGPPVKLTTTSRTQPVRLRAATRTAPAGYMTKVMRST